MKKFLSILISITMLLSLPINANSLSKDNQKMYTGVNKTLREFKTTTFKTEENSIPEKYINTDVTPVKNQLSENSCWIFSALAASEIYALKNLNLEFDFSEEHVNQWATQNSYGAGWIREPGAGAWPLTILGYLTSWQGLKNESDFPYLGYALTQKNEQYYKAENILNINAAAYINTDPTSIKTAIMKYGSVVTSYNHIETYSNKTSSYEAYCCPKLDEVLAGHSITIVGWDDNFPKTNFSATNMPKNNGAWYVKNSWGNYNSMGGYLWISYEDYYLFSDIFGTTYSITDAQLADPKTTLYQNETYGATYNYPTAGHNLETYDSTFINVFNIRQDKSILDKVIFSTECIDANYEIYLVPTDENNTPVNDMSQWTMLSSGIVPYSGYICDNFNDYELSMKTYGIGVRLLYSNESDDSSDTTKNKSVHIGISEWLVDPKGVFQFLPNAKYGKSFMYHNNSVKDVMSLYKEINDDLGGTFVIKAIVNEPEEFKYGDVNNDGVINMKDVTDIQRHLSDLFELSYQGKIKADINKDDKISMVDVTTLQKYLVELVFKLPYTD